MADTTEAVERLELLLEAGGVACASQWPTEVAPYIRALLSERTALLERVERAERERDEALDERDDQSTSADAWLAEHKLSEARAQAAETKLATLTEELPGAWAVRKYFAPGAWSIDNIGWVWAPSLKGGMTHVCTLEIRGWGYLIGGGHGGLGLEDDEAAAAQDAVHDFLAAYLASAGERAALNAQTQEEKTNG